jgi:catechol 2,3-dioxygenase-like lactoylglutathione lyase family enzyme
MVPRLDMIGLVSSDLSRSVAFYRRLGLALPDPTPAHPYLECTLPGGARFSLNEIGMVKGLHPEWESPRGQRMSLAFHCGDGASVDAVFADLVASGSPPVKAPWDAFWGQRYAIVEGPDGEHVELFAPLSPAAS